MQLVVGRITRPHGVRGEVSVEVRTDEPERRFAVGSVLATDPAEAGPLTVASARWHTGRLLVGFAGIADRNQAEDLRGIWLTLDSAEAGSSDDPDEFHDHELIGLAVVTVSGEPVGRVSDVRHQGQDLLVIEPDDLLVPFVAAIVPEVDVAAGRLVIDPPPGLLELGTAEPGRG
jgi:16S rRNA processing protein RimM